MIISSPELIPEIFVSQPVERDRRTYLSCATRFDSRPRAIMSPAAYLGSHCAHRRKLAGILRDADVNPEGLIEGKEWVHSGRRPEGTKLNFSHEMTCWKFLRKVANRQTNKQVRQQEAYPTIRRSPPRLVFRLLGEPPLGQSSQK